MQLRLTTLLASALVLLAAAATPYPAHAAKKDKKAKPDAAAAAAAGEKDKPYQDWKKVLKDAEAKPGFLTLHQKREHLYLELRPDQLDKPMLGIFSLASGIGSTRGAQSGLRRAISQAVKT